MGKFWNSRWWVGNLMIFKALASGAFDHLKCQHTREFDQFFFLKGRFPQVCPG